LRSQPDWKERICLWFFLRKNKGAVDNTVSNGFSDWGEYSMKLICKCWNIEELKTENKPINYEIKNCGDGTIATIILGDCR
jgi:hypothetical protein